MWIGSTSSLLLVPALASPVLAGVQEIWWNITYVQNASPDGLFERRVIGVNGTWPYVSILRQINEFSNVVETHI